MTNTPGKGEAPGNGQGSEDDAKLREEFKALRNDEVAFLAGRRSMAYELRQSGGLAESQLGLEILYLLPDWFVEFYQRLFHEALQVKDSSVMGAQGKSGLDKARGTTGTVLGSDTQLQASGSGKRWKNPAYTIGSERAFRAKERLDAELVQLVKNTRRWMDAQKPTSRGGIEGGGPRQCTGTIRRVAGEVGLRDKACRMFLKLEWDYCPRCGTPTQ